MVLVSTLAGGAVVVAAAQFQSEQRFGLSLAFIQSPKLVLLLAAAGPRTGVTGVREAWLALLGSRRWVVAAVWGWACSSGAPRQASPLGGFSLAARHSRSRAFKPPDCS